MPYPGGKHGPGHYVGSGGIIPPPIVADPVGTSLVFQSEGFPGPFGSLQTYTTSDGSAFSVVNVPINPGRAEFYASDLGAMAGISNDDPPTAVQQVNFNTSDTATWSNDSAAPGSLWNIFVSPSLSELWFFEVAGLFMTALINSSIYFTSPDGVTWTQRAGPWGAFNGIFNNYESDGVFDYIAASGGSLWRTTDGINWTSVQPAISNRSRIIFAGSNSGDKYWLFGGNAFGARVDSSLDGTPLSYSRNLAAEASLDAAGLIPFNNPFSVAYSNGIGGGTFVLAFEIVGTGSGSTRLAASTDGVNWVNPGSVFLGAGPVRYSGTLGQFVRTQGDSTLGALLRSGNGTSWSQNVYAGFGTLARHASSDLLVSF